MNEKDILLIDKPKGISSFGVIRILRQKLNIRKMGHSGTLDPLATGLLLVGVGKGTKKLDQLLKLPKVYIAEILLGIKTTTGDLEGQILEEKGVEISSVPEDVHRDRNPLYMETINNVLKGMVGKLKLAVPIFSAVKHEGIPLYAFARRGGNIVSPPTREMEIFNIKLLDHFPHGKGYVLKVELEVKSGTYIRSIAEEIGRRLSVPATVKELRRTRVGDFRVEDAEKLV